MTEEQKERKRARRKIREAAPEWREKHRAYERAYYASHLDKFRAHDKKRRKSSKRSEYMKKYLKEYGVKNRERLRIQAEEWKKEWIKNNPEAFKESYKSYYQKNRKWIREKFQITYQTSKDRLNARLRERKKLQPGKFRLYNLKRKLPPERIDPSASAFMDRIRAMKWVPCYWCGKPVRGKDAHIDHVIALAKGGNHCSSNICASCETCNFSKGAKYPSDWDKHPQMALNL